MTSLTSAVVAVALILADFGSVRSQEFQIHSNPILPTLNTKSNNGVTVPGEIPPGATSPSFVVVSSGEMLTPTAAESVVQEIVQSGPIQEETITVDHVQEGDPPLVPAKGSQRDARSEHYDDTSFLEEVIVLGLPVLFIPALGLALMYLIWAGMNSSYNYHNGFPSHGQGVAFQQNAGGHGGGHHGGHGGHGWRRRDFRPRMDEDVAQRVMDSI